MEEGARVKHLRLALSKSLVAASKQCSYSQYTLIARGIEQVEGWFPFQLRPDQLGKIDVRLQAALARLPQRVEVNADIFSIAIGALCRVAAGEWPGREA